MAAPKLSAERLRELLHYDPETGVFTWRVARGTVKAGVAAGYMRRDGYVELSIDGAPVLAHRLAWLYVHGEWPAGQIDHRDGNRANNRTANLRDVEPLTNRQNQRFTSKRGLMGAYYRPDAGKWVATIKTAGIQRYLGRFDTEDEAHAAYIREKKRSHAGYVPCEA